MLSTLLKEKNMKAYELANLLGVHVTQIYKWNKEGIPESNPHAPQLKELFPTLEFTPATKRSKAGKPKKELTLTDVDIPNYYKRKEHISDFPKITFKKR